MSGRPDPAPAGAAPCCGRPAEGGQEEVCRALRALQAIRDLYLSDEGEGSPAGIDGEDLLHVVGLALRDNGLLPP